MMFTFMVFRFLLLFLLMRFGGGTKSYTISTIMGTGVGGTTGENGPATSAGVYYASSVWQNTIYETFVAEAYSGCVRKINSLNIVNTYAGSCNNVGGGVYNFDNVQATLSNLYYPYTIYIDSSSKMYISDFSNSRIRLVATNGIISTVAGGGASAADSISALSAFLYNPFSVWLNSVGVIYIAEYSGSRVRYVVNSIIYTLAGAYATASFYGDGLSASLAYLYVPYDAVQDSTGATYIADTGNYRLRYVNLAGIISTIAGTGGAGYNGDNIPATSATVNYIVGMYIESVSGDIYFNDWQNCRVRVITRTTGIISTIAGIGCTGSNGDNGPATSAGIYAIGMYADSTGRFYITDYAGFKVRVLNVKGTPTSQPSSQPSGQPTSQPTNQPTSQPSSHPSNQPSRQPSAQPVCRPTTHPSNQPTSQPTCQPSGQPSSKPSCQPTTRPSMQPLSRPSTQPTHHPSDQPSSCPSQQPSRQPSSQPTCQPTAQPVCHPSQQPSAKPTCQPTSRPSVQPAIQPTRQPWSTPSVQPTSHPSSQPTDHPSHQPTRRPSAQPSSRPSDQPSSQPSSQPSLQPSSQPSCIPSIQPSSQPSMHPSSHPSSKPSIQPSSIPSRQPSRRPTRQPTSEPSHHPSSHPTTQPSVIPSHVPTLQPTTQPSTPPSTQPSRHPSVQPSSRPSSQPSSQPTCQPSMRPSCRPSGIPTSQPTERPSHQPSSRPSQQPSIQPSSMPTMMPTASPSSVPSAQPSGRPSLEPTVMPSCRPSSQPSGQPSHGPTVQPSCRPSSGPSSVPSGRPTCQPSQYPSSSPSSRPSRQPTSQPSRQPVTQPTAQPSVVPSLRPSKQPSSNPSMKPTSVPSGHPSAHPLSQPTTQPSDRPSNRPSSQPSFRPSKQPSARPSLQPVSVPSVQPSCQPVFRPSSAPSVVPTHQPSNRPSEQPSRRPSSQPSGRPVVRPSSQPSRQPSSQPSRSPTEYLLGRPIASLPSNLSISVVDETGADVTSTAFKIVLPFFFVNPLTASEAFSSIVVSSEGSVGTNYVVFGNRSVASLTLSDTPYGKVYSMDNAVTYDRKGRSVSVLEDFNGDGIADVIIGDPFVSRCYVLFGRSDRGFANMTEGFTIFGEKADLTGWSVSGAGDVNNDTYQDLLVGAPLGGSKGGGAVFVIYGSAEHMADIYLSNLTAYQGFVLYGSVKGDYLGVSVSNAGDVNGDRVDDVLVSALLTGKLLCGSVFVVYGAVTPPTLHLIENITQSEGYQLVGVPFSLSGYSVSGVGDVNRDGLDDFLVGSSPQSSSLSPASYLIYGSRLLPSSKLLTSLKPTDGITLSGGGTVVSGIGDVNHDGFADLLIGAYSTDARAGYVVKTDLVFVSNPSRAPSLRPSFAKTKSPTGFPFVGLSATPSVRPSVRPSTVKPSAEPTTAVPSASPSAQPSSPTFPPTHGATEPTSTPSSRPTCPSSIPTDQPVYPSSRPTARPTSYPSKVVTPEPTEVPTTGPTTRVPSLFPSAGPSKQPRGLPTLRPSVFVSYRPSAAPVSVELVAINDAVVSVDRQQYNMHFVFNSSGSAEITGFAGADIFTVLPNPSAVLIIDYFNISVDLIDLSAFPKIITVNDVNMTSGSVIIHLPNLQVVRILNLHPVNMTAKHFIFAVPSASDDDNAGGGAMSEVNFGYYVASGAVFGAFVLSIVGFCLYRYYKHSVRERRNKLADLTILKITRNRTDQDWRVDNKRLLLLDIPVELEQRFQLLIDDLSSNSSSVGSSERAAHTATKNDRIAVEVGPPEVTTFPLLNSQARRTTWHRKKRERSEVINISDDDEGSDMDSVASEATPVEEVSDVDDDLQTVDPSLILTPYSTYGPPARMKLVSMDSVQSTVDSVGSVSVDSVMELGIKVLKERIVGRKKLLSIDSVGSVEEESRVGRRTRRTRTVSELFNHEEEEVGSSFDSVSDDERQVTGMHNTVFGGVMGYVDQPVPISVGNRGPLLSMDSVQSTVDSLASLSDAEEGQPANATEAVQLVENTTRNRGTSPRSTSRDSRKNIALKAAPIVRTSSVSPRVTSRLRADSGHRSSGSSPRTSKNSMLLKKINERTTTVRLVDTTVASTPAVAARATVFDVEEIINIPQEAKDTSIHLNTQSNRNGAADDSSDEAISSSDFSSNSSEED